MIPAGTVTSQSSANAVIAPVRETDRARRFAFLVGILLVFVRFSDLHEIQAVAMGFNLRLLYIFGLPAIVGAVLADGLRRSFRGRPAYYSVAYTVWMAIAVPFSSWRGGSLWTVLSYIRTNLVMLFVIAGLVVTWRECRVVMYAIAAGAVVNLASARIFARTDLEARRSLEFGQIANANDFAAHLLLVLPFLLWIVLSSRSLLLRLLALMGIGVGIYFILTTASRGALVALVVEILFFLARAKVRQRLALIVMAPVALASLLALVPETALQRIVSFSGGSTAVEREAAESSEGREYVLRKSIQYALEHPLFGIGAAQFATYEGDESRAAGSRGYWHVAHNTYTQAASECGIPAMLFLVAGIFSSFRLFNSTWREARRRPGCEDIATAVFCIMLGMLGFCVAVTFLSFAYSFYFPALGGFAISVSCAAREEFAAREALAGTGPNPPVAFGQPPPLPRNRYPGQFNAVAGGSRPSRPWVRS